MNFVRISNVKLQQYRPMYAWKSSKIGCSVWTSASVLVVAMQKKSRYIHNAIERTLTGIWNSIDIQNRFCFISKNFSSALIENHFIIACNKCRLILKVRFVLKFRCPSFGGFDCWFGDLQNWPILKSWLWPIDKKLAVKKCLQLFNILRTKLYEYEKIYF